MKIFTHACASSKGGFVMSRRLDIVLRSLRFNDKSMDYTQEQQCRKQKLGQDLHRGKHFSGSSYPDRRFLFVSN